jgi:hypothetical protein
MLIIAEQKVDMIGLCVCMHVWPRNFYCSGSSFNKINDINNFYMHINKDRLDSSIEWSE